MAERMTAEREAEIHGDWSVDCLDLNELRVWSAYHGPIWPTAEKVHHLFQEWDSANKECDDLKRQLAARDETIAELRAACEYALERSWPNTSTSEKLKAALATEPGAAKG